MTPQPIERWPAGGTVYGSSQLFLDEPADTPGRFAQLPPDPTSTSRVWNPVGERIHYGGRYPARRHLAARWARQNRGRVVALTALFVVLSYAATVATFFDRTLPTAGSATALVAVGAVMVALLLSVVIWSRHE